MIKYLVSVAFIGLIAMSSCKNMDEGENPNNQVFQDSIFNKYSNGGEIIVQLQYQTNLSTTFWNKEMFNANDEDRKTKAFEIAAMALRIYGKDNTLEKLKVIVTKDKQSPQKTVTINLDSLKKATKMN